MIRRKQNIIQIFLILTGILLIFLTYIFYPKIKQSSIIPSDLIEKDESYSNTFVFKNLLKYLELKAEEHEKTIKEHEKGWSME